ncbi:endonuclease/exonuclease/phosphatase family protein [Sulfitobacter guttiformis]|uniref:endonuclease/exonuclease/phosphatase family protein n=1 Tax=Sulfitobacter guttiformis TaxID=74349 RepID=UPI001E4A5658|nr:endonuclease/exonuclease/phosphatase family protein [Sulfitobacter guttiformis]
MRIATFNAELMRKGPGLLLRDIQRGKDPQLDAFVALLVDVRPDVITLQGIDYDLRQTALNALASMLAQAGLEYSYMFSSAPNAGQASGLDLNGNGTLGDADDAHGYGRFNGMGGMAVLSRFPIVFDAVQDFTPMLWRDLKNHIYPFSDGQPFGGGDVFAAHRLSSRNHWVVPIQTPHGGTLRLMTFHATPPVYDGDEDRNGRRNHDEVAFWLDYLAFDTSDLPFVLAGTANIDPVRSSGRPTAIKELLASPLLQNPFDDSPTADFKDPFPGNLRVDYLLPSTHWRVTGQGIVGAPAVSRHSLLWLDITPTDP